MLKIQTKQVIADVAIAAAAAQGVADFRASRAAAVESAVVTVNGNQYNANERSIQRMAATVQAAYNEPDHFGVGWSMADTEPGVMTWVTLGELRQALRAAIENMATLWAR